MDTLPSRILITLGSAVSIGFGIWHFFVPRLWNWFSYIDATASELVVAIRAINGFFSLSLVLFGLMDLLLVYGPGDSRYAALVVLGATCVLWSARVVMQIAYPQGSMSVILQYGLLVAFALVLACYSVSLVLVLLDEAHPDQCPAVSRSRSRPSRIRSSPNSKSTEAPPGAVAVISAIARRFGYSPAGRLRAKAAAISGAFSVSNDQAISWSTKP